jgi:2-polyprenyl-3-methyl-5-hydroxy-6-metoxy-1,4-benzoquinol methylase
MVEKEIVHEAVEGDIKDSTSVDFDEYAHNYREILRSGLRISGEKDDYFDRYKLNCLRRWACKPDQAGEILDFGCGIGKLTELIGQAYPQSIVFGYDISPESIHVARKRSAHLKNVLFETQIPNGTSYDLIIAANVFHHIGEKDRAEILLKLRALLKPEGMIIIFEHNPFNPLTLYIVKTCPLDKGAALITLGRFIRLARECQLQVQKKRYIVFFPRFLRYFRKFEASLGFLPLGAQYMALFVASQ